MCDSKNPPNMSAFTDSCSEPFFLAEALDKQGEFGDVVPILKRCVTINPDDANSWVYLGIALDQAGEPSDARKAYEKAISIGGYTEVNAAAIELARVCLSHPRTAATFRGHRLGERWQTFIRSEAGLCQLKQNAEDCTKAASGAKATLSQFGKDGYVTFSFEYGRLAGVVAMMSGSTFVEPGFFEKAYGAPSNKYGDPAKGSLDSYWRFSDGGEAHPRECFWEDHQCGLAAGAVAELRGAGGSGVSAGVAERGGVWRGRVV